MKYGRIVNGRVDEIFHEPAGFVITECFVPDIALLFELIPDEVEMGWKKHLNGSFTAPPVKAEMPVTTIA